MMSTRQHILGILSERGEATIDEIATSLRLRMGKSVSSVTIRYHLNILLGEGLVSEPRTVPRTSRGRPQHVFAAAACNRGRGNSAEMLSYLLNAIEAESEAVSGAVFDRVILAMSREASFSALDSLEERISNSVVFLNSRGYDAAVEKSRGGYVLHTSSCPYHDVPKRTNSLCSLDMRLIEVVVGRPIVRLTRIAEGDNVCSYFIEEIF